MVEKNKKKEKENDQLFLKAELRKLVGKKTNKIRREGYLAANVYGRKFKSKTIKVLAKEFFNIYKKVKGTGIFYLKLVKEKIPVLVRNVQYHPVKNYILHIDFRQVDLARKIITQVPLKIVGESEAVENKLGDLNVPLSRVEIESLPQNIPTDIKVDISSLKEVGGEIKIADLAQFKKYTFTQPPETVLVSISTRRKEKIEAPTPVVEEQGEEEKEGKEKGEEGKANETDKEGQNKKETGSQTNS